MSAMMENLITAYRRDRIHDVPDHALIQFDEFMFSGRSSCRVMLDKVRDWLMHYGFTVQISEDHMTRSYTILLDRDNRQIRHREAMLAHARTSTQIVLTEAQLTHNSITGFFNPQLGVPFTAAKPARSLASGLQERRRHIQTTQPPRETGA